MVVHVCNPSHWESKQEDHKFQATHLQKPTNPQREVWDKKRTENMHTSNITQAEQGVLMYLRIYIYVCIHIYVYV